MSETTTPHHWFDFNDPVPMAALPQHDLNRLRTSLRDHAELVLRYLFPHGKFEGHRFLIGNLGGAPGKSLVVELQGERRGLWMDFATDESGDLIDLWAAVHHLSVQSDFQRLVRDIAAWLALPVAGRPVPAAPDVALDTLGRHAAKWDYFSVDGKLLACIYRYDTSEGKEYRPWNPVARNHSMPSPRPLFHLPQIDQADTVVLVEGEKCAEALQGVGIVATTAMGGAKAPLDKTDWSPLKGKIVILWPDHDQTGQQYMEKLIPILMAIGVKALRRIAIPGDKPAKWDAADAVAEGMNIDDLLTNAVPVGSFGRRIVDWHAADRFRGEPLPRRWLIDGVFPLAQPALVAAGGGVGKSYLLLSLARSVAAYDGAWLDAPSLFGGTLTSHGVAIYITAEDDAIEVHERMHQMGPIPAGLYVMPLPDAGGAMALFGPDPVTRGPAITPAWQALRDELSALAGLCLVVLDPLQPLCALDLNVPENAQFVCSSLAALAADTGASVIVSHHFAKREAATPEQAREAIRGTGGLVDGVRAVYALWHPKEAEARHICEILDESFERGRVVMGAVVKANGRANLGITSYIRNRHGLLIDRTAEMAQNIRDLKNEEDLRPQLKAAIAETAEQGIPYTKTGMNGAYERRFELPTIFHGIGKHKLVGWIDELLAAGELVSAMVQGSRVVKWLDIPTGPIARGVANFRPGHIDRSNRGRKKSEADNSAHESVSITQGETPCCTPTSSI
ncbi:MAG: AAA family ATPase [Burkholderiales bacterium]